MCSTLYYRKYIKKGTDCGKAVIVPLYKKGNGMECSNYQGTSLLIEYLAGKVYTQVLQQRLKKYVEESLAENKQGFAQAGHSEPDNCVQTAY